MSAISSFSWRPPPTICRTGPLTGTNVLWNSSRDGFLGYGNLVSLATTGLSEGRHVLAVTTINSYGLTNRATVTITVLRQLPPALAIQLAGGQVPLSWLASATNYLLGTTTSRASGTWSTVTNAPTAADITPTVDLNQSSTNRFFRLRLP